MNESMKMKTFGTNPGERHLRNLMEDPRYWRDQDPEYVAMIQQGFEDLYKTNPETAQAFEGKAANQIGLNGTNHKQDSEIAHVTPGEIVIPLSAQTPELLEHLQHILGSNLMKYTVGSGSEQVNPTSGLPAFADQQTSCPALHPREFKYLNSTTAYHKGTLHIYVCKTNTSTGEKYWEKQSNKFNPY